MVNFRARPVLTKLDQHGISTVSKMLDEIFQQSNEFTPMAVGIHHQNQLVNSNIADLIIRPGVDQTASHYLVSSSLCPLNFHQTDKKNYKTKILFDRKNKFRMDHTQYLKANARGYSDINTVCKDIAKLTKSYKGTFLVLFSSFHHPFRIKT